MPLSACFVDCLQQIFSVLQYNICSIYASLHLCCPHTGNSHTCVGRCAHASLNAQTSGAQCAVGLADHHITIQWKQKFSSLHFRVHSAISPSCKSEFCKTCVAFMHSAYLRLYALFSCHHTISIGCIFCSYIRIVTGATSICSANCQVVKRFLKR